MIITNYEHNDGKLFRFKDLFTFVSRLKEDVTSYVTFYIKIRTCVDLEKE